MIDLSGWPVDGTEALAIQDELRSKLRQEDDPRPIRTVAGVDVDVAYARGSERLVAAAVVLDADSYELVDTAVVHGMARFPYLPGLLAFRELPAVLDALDRLGTMPDVVVCDGQGVAHPRRFGLACHLGVATGLRTIGAAKTPYGAFDLPGEPRGSWTEVRDGADVVGRALRTQSGVKPVFVSVGHRISLESACSLILRLCPRYRLPETTRQSDRLARQHLDATSVQKGARRPRTGAGR